MVFLKTHLYLLAPQTDFCSSYKPLVPQFIQRRVEAHIRFFVGQGDVTITQPDMALINGDLWRSFFGDLKASVNLVLFPFEYSSLLKDILAERAIDFCGKHQKKLQFLLFLGLSALAITIYTGLLVLPFTMPLAAVIAGVFATTFFAPELTKIALKPISLAATLAEPMIKFPLLFVSVLITALVSGIKNLGKYLLSEPQPLAEAKPTRLAPS